MPSSKGKPTDPKLREELKEKIKNEPNKSGGGKGGWAAWKASKLSKEYEAHGGGYENEPGSKNEPKQGAPEHKSEGKKEKETKSVSAKATPNKSTPNRFTKSKDDDEKPDQKQDKNGVDGNDEEEAEGAAEEAGGKDVKPRGKGRPKANSSAKKIDGKKAGGAATMKKKAERPKAEGTRKSSRIQGKRAADFDGEAEPSKKVKK